MDTHAYMENVEELEEQIRNLSNYHMDSQSFALVEDLQTAVVELTEYLEELRDSVAGKNPDELTQDYRDLDLRMRQVDALIGSIGQEDLDEELLAELQNPLGELREKMSEDWEKHVDDHKIEITDSMEHAFDPDFDISGDGWVAIENAAPSLERLEQYTNAIRDHKEPAIDDLDDFDQELDGVGMHIETPTEHGIDGL